MSITFWIPQAPVERVTPYPDMDPEYREVRCVEPFVEINMTASNANAILALIDPESVNFGEDPHGEWDRTALARVRTATLYALNSGAKGDAVLPDEEGTGAGGCRVVYYGRDLDYVTRRLENFLALTKVAMDHGFSVTFG